MAPSRSQREACTLPTDVNGASGFARAVDCRIVQSSFYLFTRYIYQIVMSNTRVCPALPVQPCCATEGYLRRTSVNVVGDHLIIVGACVSSATDGDAMHLPPLACTAVWLWADL